MLLTTELRKSLAGTGAALTRTEARAEKAEREVRELTARLHRLVEENRALLAQLKSLGA